MFFTRRVLKGKLGTQRGLQGHSNTWALVQSKHLDTWALEHSKGTWALRHWGIWELKALETLYLIDS